MNKRTTNRSLRVLYIVLALFAVAMTLKAFALQPQLALQENGIAFSLIQNH
jgi:hypothetical protein